MKSIRYWVVMLIALLFSAGPSASAKGRGGGGRGRSSNWGGRKMGSWKDHPSYKTNQHNNWRSPELDKAEKIEKKIEKNTTRPPGWDKGKKKGWDSDVPPGLSNLEHTKPKDGTPPCYPTRMEPG